MRRKLLIITTTDIKNPKRGTPIRIVKFIEQFAKEFDITLVAESADERPELYQLLSMPKGNQFSRFQFFLGLIKDKKFSYIFTPTEVDIKMVVLLGLLTGTKTAIDVHGVSHEEDLLFGRRSKLSTKVKSVVNRFLFLFFTRVYVVSGRLKQYYNLGDKGVVIYGGVDLEEFPYIGEPSKNTHEKIVVSYMGNTRSYQGLGLLAEALKKIKQQGQKFIFNFVASGDEAEVKGFLQAHDLLEYTDLYMNVDHSEVNKYLNSADLLVIPRPLIPVTEFAYPSKLTECLATGIPVLVTKVGPVEELLIDQKHCLITPPTSDGVAEGLRHFLELSEESRRLIGKNARELVEGRLTWDRLGRVINNSLL